MLGGWVREVVRRNPDNFRLFGPDEIASNRLQDVFAVTDRQFDGENPRGRRSPGPRRVGPLEMLSEHMCQGWLEGYLLTGRHGLFTCYEAFIHIVDSMSTSTPSGCKVTRGIPWRRPIA